MHEKQRTRLTQRYRNYQKIITIFESEIFNIEDFSVLKTMGTIKCFELAFDLLWKLFKDYLTLQEIDIEIISPKPIIRKIAAVGLLEKMNVNGDLLFDMHKNRNNLVHVYDKAEAENIVATIKNDYICEFKKVADFFERYLNDN